jgi:hypothetical protein
VNVKQRSFWSSTAGFVTGAAGLVTAVVGALATANQLGWIGSDGDGGSPGGTTTATTAVAPGGNVGGGGGATSPGGVTPAFTVEPTRITFEPLGTRKATVKVVNTGSVALTVQNPIVSGANPSAFSATASTCTRSRLDAGRSCEVEVTFDPPRAGSYTATLAVQASGLPAREVDLSGSVVL